MTTLRHSAAVNRADSGYALTQPVDNYVLATRVVHRAETLLEAAADFPQAIAHIEAGFEAALSLTADSTWVDVRAARQHLDEAQAELERHNYRLS
ncbi:hypothetical protein [Nocardioides pelophilus]|uniref:hypothetical protein n=1 Tax=Nocardioides pelophilus TaxID=2172019 RepID=UPI0016022C0E|nr:hypothetical protein [Nocardioides pelophilus]